ncbi:dipeptidase family protein [Clostridium pasteurianum DSM 525 = ATCC 6013]|uniref:Dipeptidase family protein n=1 Tax=Clostridium pasteurianum DSM 525 = ATCC 6013 TaxID=1262449 RepID=A0A0H3J7Y1_CLOPA|nr:dipeptidase [Clostridium pasteurianum]AJA50016.1 dipeptidase family protein [Clostridium pasteurianum DSM 525 = ATCC 6013]AJA54004.1 dipeptidase family protein [Clostridium pasteurianum DSM 525 = ATCC 6013]AOZ77147.1 peptidase M19 [Clostridium pasteurianum DSM 525 = ATCC 6013]AOZ80944.1 peptidase M19 [Clostridium pasteurianum]ELP59274.1 microsomal dipeptidase [Clostridium pasteurianum DSM 525 = ATCC 6013]
MKVIDFHCDTISKLMDNPHTSNLGKNNFSVDIQKLKGGNNLAQFFALFINSRLIDDPLEYCLAMVDKFYTELKDNDDLIGFVKSYDELINNNNENKLSAFLTIEGGETLNGKLCNLRNFYRLGVRLITLTWNYPNEIGFPNSKKEYMERGLTKFGYEVLEEMNKLHMIIDVSHLSDRGFYDVAAASKRPFIASHSNSRFIANHPRNLTDSMIKELSNRGGIMGINFYNKFLGKSTTSKIDDIILHIKHIYKIGGIDVIALGSDFDGIDCDVEIKDTSEMYKLENELKKNGFNEDSIEKIFYKNALRIIKDI